MKTTVKFKFRASLRMPGSGILVLCVTRHRKTSSTTTPYLLSKEEWDENTQSVVFYDGIPEKRRKELSSIRRRIRKDFREITESVKTLEERGDYTSRDVIRRFCSQRQGQLFCEYVSQKSAVLREAGKFGTAHTYEYSSRSFLKFLGGKDIRINKINSVLMEGYERHLLLSGCSKNTVSCYMRTLRAGF